MAEITGMAALSKIGLTTHPMVETAYSHSLEFDLVEEGETQILSWVSTITSKSITVMVIEARTFIGAAGEVELEFLRQAVVWAAKKAIAAVTGKAALADGKPEAAKSFSVSHQEAKKHAAQKEVWQTMNAGHPKATPTGVIKEYIMPKIFPADKMSSATTIKLSSADALYQPVIGTSGNSRYFVMGVGKGLNLACRIKGKTMSARVEGSALKTQQIHDLCGTIGLTFGKGGDYASMHVECDDMIVAQKSVGSVLAALSKHVEWETPIPSVQKIVGIGA